MIITKTLQDRRIGVWKLVSNVDKPVAGSAPFHPIGEEPEGILMDTPFGYTSEQLRGPGLTPALAAEEVNAQAAPRSLAAPDARSTP